MVNGGINNSNIGFPITLGGGSSGVISFMGRNGIVDLIISDILNAIESPSDLFYVSPNGQDDSTHGGFLDPWQTIQYAIDNIPSSSIIPTINVAPGQYIEDINIGSKSIILKGMSAGASMYGNVKNAGMLMAYNMSFSVPLHKTTINFTGGDYGASLFTFENCNISAQQITFNNMVMGVLHFTSCTLYANGTNGTTGIISLNSSNTKLKNNNKTFTNMAFKVNFDDCFLGGGKIKIEGTHSQINFRNCKDIAQIDHVAGDLILKGNNNIIVNTITDPAIISTGTASRDSIIVQGYLDLWQSKYKQYAIINKTGNCEAWFNNFTMAKTGNTLNGTINYYER